MFAHFKLAQSLPVASLGTTTLLTAQQPHRCILLTCDTTPDAMPRLTLIEKIMAHFTANIDSISDFPSLSGGPRPQQNNANTPGWNSSAIRQPSMQQQPLGQQPQQRAPSAAPSQQSLDQFDNQRSQPLSAADRAGSGDDFPPLGGQLNGDTFGQSNGFGNVIGSPDTQQPRMNGQQSQLPMREGSAPFPRNQASIPDISSPLPQPEPSSNVQRPPPSNVKRYADMTEAEKWGLPGLMAAYEARGQAENGGQVDETLPPMMRSTVIMGHDLSTLGMDLDSSEPIHPTFTPFPASGSSGSEFNFHERHIVPDFTLPNAYTVTNVPPLSSRMSAFADGTSWPLFLFSFPAILTLQTRNPLLNLLPNTPRHPPRTRSARTNVT